MDEQGELQLTTDGKYTEEGLQWLANDNKGPTGKLASDFLRLCEYNNALRERFARFIDRRWINQITPDQIGYYEVTMDFYAPVFHAIWNGANWLKDGTVIKPIAWRTIIEIDRYKGV